MVERNVHHRLLLLDETSFATTGAYNPLPSNCTPPRIRGVSHETFVGVLDNSQPSHLKLLVYNL